MKTCSVCGAMAWDKGRCREHSQMVAEIKEIAKIQRPEFCTFTDCQGKHYAKNYCEKHYKRLHIHGDPGIKLKTGPKKNSGVIVIKEKKGVATVVEINGLRYVLDHQNQYKGAKK